MGNRRTDTEIWHDIIASDMKQQKDYGYSDFDETEQIIVDIITEKGEIDINTLSVASGIATSKLLSSLMGLEFKGVIKSYPGNRYKIR